MEDSKYPPAEISDSEIIYIKADDGSQIQPLLKIGKMLFPAAPVKRGYSPDPRTNIPEIQKMNINEDDVCICAHPKTGTHWLWEITMMMLKEKAEYDTSPKEMTMMEFKTPKDLENVARPRVLNTHLPVEFLPEQLFQKKCKILFIQRNPKDMVVSFYNHLSKIQKPLQGQWPAFLRAFIEGNCSFGPWTTYTKGFDKLIADNQDSNILPLYFEDLKRDPVGEIRKIGKFLGREVNDSLVNEIAEKCNFQNLKKADIEVKKGNKVVQPGSLYRKGEVGDWKNWFTVAQNELFDEMLTNKMSDCSFKYTYTLNTEQ